MLAAFFTVGALLSLGAAGGRVIATSGTVAGSVSSISSDTAAASGGSAGSPTALDSGSNSVFWGSANSAGGDDIIDTGFTSGLCILGSPRKLDSGLFACGGHSRRCAASIFVASPVLFDTALRLRGGVVGWRLTCCSNRPMRFATLARGRSSGNGLGNAFSGRSHKFVKTCAHMV